MSACSCSILFITSPILRASANLLSIMRPQARLFSVEIKSRRRNAAPAVPATAPRQDDWIDAVTPDDVPSAMSMRTSLTPLDRAWLADKPNKSSPG